MSAAERQTLAPDGGCRIKPIRKRRCTLAEWGTRRILALLREPEHAAGSRPQPALAELQQLVADYREAGLPVRLEWTGQRQPLSGGVEFSVYRVVQEALMNVLKPGRPASLRARSSRGPRHAPDRRRREAADSGQPGIPFPARLVGEGIPRGRACHACVGRARAHLPLAPRDLQINSICHFFGRRRFATSDRSTNVAWLSLATFGESWHNNHHAFPHRRSTDFGAGSSTSATSSSVLSRRQGSRGRWCGSPQSASVRGPRPARRSGRRSA